jgi:hypothetical protein
MLRFTIRDVILLTVIVALIAALLLERRARRNERLVTVNWTSEEELEWANYIVGRSSSTGRSWTS